MQTVADLQLFHVLKYTITGNKYKLHKSYKKQLAYETNTAVCKMVVVTMSTNSRLMRLTSELSPHFWR